MRKKRIEPHVGIGVITIFLILGIVVLTKYDYFFECLNQHILEQYGRGISIEVLKINVLFLIVPMTTSYLIFLYTQSKIDFTHIFIVTVIVAFVIFNISIVIDSSFTGFDNYWDFGDMTFSSVPDKYYSTIVSYSNSPIYGTNYPPIAVVIMKMLGKLYKSECDMYISNYLTTMIIMFSSIAIVYLVITILKDDKNKYLIALTYLLSGPILFEYQRLNITIIAFILLWIYVISLDSDDRKKQLLGILCLILSANIKLFPAIFGLLLIKNKRYKDAVISFLGGLGLFFLPKGISMLGGLFKDGSTVENGVESFAQNVGSFVNGFAGGSVSMQDIVFRICRTVGYDNNNVINKIGLIMTGITLLIGIMGVIVAKSRYQELLILTMLCIFVPTISYWYSLIYLLIPITEFIQRKPSGKCDWIQYVIIMSLMVCTYRNLIFPIHSYIRLVLLWFIIIIQVFSINIFGRKHSTSHI